MYDFMSIIGDATLEKLQRIISTAVDAELATIVAGQKLPDPEVDWSKRIERLEEDGNANRENFFKARLAAFAPMKRNCDHCNASSDYAISCATCRLDLCQKCDAHVHGKLPFHKRDFISEESFQFGRLNATTFIDHHGKPYHKGI